MDYTLRCISCGKVYAPVRGRYTCDDCGNLMGTLEVVYDLSKVAWKRDFDPKGSLYQFQDLLPTKPITERSDVIGGTPLLAYPGLLGFDNVLIKADSISFSGSYKDRASIMAVNQALEWGDDTIFCASTGNAASSLALVAAGTGLRTVIFVPATIPKGKLAQLKAAGADVYAIRADYDAVFDFSLEIGLERGWYCRNSAINPVLLEGKKTGAYEIVVQNGYVAPEVCVVGVGDGTVISGICKGFVELATMGLIDKAPRVFGVQSENAAAVTHVFKRGAPYTPVAEPADTVADSISVGNPRDVVKACRYVASTGGGFITVSDEEILSAIGEMTRKTGIFAEPAGAAPFAAAKKMKQQGLIEASARLCLVVTGNGLKDVDAVRQDEEPKTYSMEEAARMFADSL